MKTWVGIGEILMCFSPQASFTAAGILTVGGYFTVRKALHLRDMRMFAIVPFVFAIHQFLEGMVWLSLDDAQGAIWRIAYYSIALLLWPVATPLAALVTEPSEGRKNILLAFLAIGVALAAYLSWKLLFVWDEIQVSVQGHSLRYQPLPQSTDVPAWTQLVYALVTIGPLLASSRRVVQILGASIGIAFAITYTAMHTVYISTWCMSSAILSLIIYLAIGASRDGVPPGGYVKTVAARSS